MTTDILTPADLHPLLQAICDAEPDRVNPMADLGNGRFSCLYRTTDPNDNCVVGRLVRTEGWRFPHDNMEANELAFRDCWPVTNAGASYLGSVQVQADGGYEGDTVQRAPRKWGTLILDPAICHDKSLWVETEPLV